VPEHGPAPVSKQFEPEEEKGVRGAPKWAKAQCERLWERFHTGGPDAPSCDVIGLGRSGLDLTTRARAFHLRMVGLRRRVDLPAPGVDTVRPPERFHRFLPESDFSVDESAGTEPAARPSPSRRGTTDTRKAS
jgi:phosphoglycerate dehydrogenase-like enzyme